MEVQYFKDLLNNRSLKATSTRVNLLTNIQQYESAMPYSAIQSSMKAIDRVTLYRTLETLTGQGIIHKAYQENNEVYYAICGKQCSKEQHKHDHVHFKCENCLAVTCEHLNKAVKLSLPDHEIYKISININGVCKSCLGKI